MKRKFRFNYGTSAIQRYDRMKIHPPVFKSIADAYNHFVRHPEERQIIDNPKDWFLGDGMDDCFDRLESLQSSLGAQASSQKAADSQARQSAEPLSDEPPEVQDDGQSDPS